MKTNFKSYLKKKNAQEAIDKIAEDYSGKKIVLYGVEHFTEDLFKNYDLSKLNVIGIADRTFHEYPETEYYGYHLMKDQELLTLDFDLLLITTYDDSEVKPYLKKDLLKDSDYNFKIKTLINMNVVEYIKGLFNGDF